MASPSPKAGAETDTKVILETKIRYEQMDAATVVATLSDEFLKGIIAEERGAIGLAWLVAGPGVWKISLCVKACSLFSSVHTSIIAVRCWVLGERGPLLHNFHVNKNRIC